MTNNDEIKRLGKHIKDIYRDPDSGKTTEIMKAWTDFILLDQKDSDEIFIEDMDTGDTFSFKLNEYSYIYMLDNGQGLIIDSKKMEFDEAIKKILQNFSNRGIGFNYIRRITVLNFEIQEETHLLPEYVNPSFFS